MSPASSVLVRSAGRRIGRADAEYLLGHLLGCRRHELYLGVEVPPRIATRFARLVKQAEQGCPVQYLVGTAPFMDFTVKVNRRVLIPRPETEELVLRALARLHRFHAGASSLLVLDFGTGSGCIAIAVARQLPRARIIAVDRSLAALRLAQENARRLGAGRRIRFIQAATLTARPLVRLGGRLDLLIANPPYIPAERFQRLPRAVRDYEPRLALDGGPKGTKIVEMLLSQGPALLRPQGLLAIEIDHTQGRYVCNLAPTAEIEPDLAGRTRYVFLTATA